MEGGSGRRPRPAPLDKYIHMVILPETPFGLAVVFFNPSGAEEGPVEKELTATVRQPKELEKVQQVLRGMEWDGIRTPGLRVEKVKGTAAALYELKIKAFGSEHRFLAGYTGTRTPEGKPHLLVVKYLKKKEWKLKRTAIETAVARLMRTG